MTALALLDSVVALEGPADVVAAVTALFPAADPAPDAHRRTVALDGTRVLLDGEVVATCGRGPAQQVQAVLTQVNAAVLADVRAPAVHAGVVAVDGAAVAWAGVSGAGKSTLTAACLRAGFALVSDEALVLDDGLVRPYPRPVGLSAWSLRALGLPGPEPDVLERPVPPGELGATVAAGPVRVAHLVRLERRPGPPELRVSSRAGAALHLLEHAFNHHRLPERAFHAAADAAEGGQCWVLGLDRPDEAAQLLRAVLA